MKRTLIFLVIVMLAGVANAQQAQRPGVQPLDIRDQTIGTLRQKQVGSLILPQGKGPFPAVVVMHGCNGVSANTVAWARRLASWGYAALIVNSFTSRGVKQVCDGSRLVPGIERAMDAFAAAEYLRSHPEIDPARIAVVGYSHGGWSALLAAMERNVVRASARPFGAVIAYYPYCPVGPGLALASDVLILIGDADDWTSASRCQTFVKAYGEGAVHRPVLVVYPGARHSFEARRPERLYFGHKLAYDAKATADALERTRKFLDDHLRQR